MLALPSWLVLNDHWRHDREPVHHVPCWKVVRLGYDVVRELLSGHLRGNRDGNLHELCGWDVQCDHGEHVEFIVRRVPVGPLLGPAFDDLRH